MENKIIVHEERVVAIEENEVDRIENKRMIFYTNQYDYKNSDCGDHQYLSMHMVGLIMSALTKLKTKEESKQFYDIHAGEFEVAFNEIPGIKVENLTIVPKSFLTEKKVLSPLEIKKYEKTKISIPLKTIYKKRYGLKK